MMKTVANTSPTTSRDFYGYGPVLPQVQWPEHKRVAVSFVLNFEEGGEFSMTDGDDHNESVYEVIDSQSRADQCIDTHFEYGTRTAYWRLSDLFEQFGLKYTLSSCGRAVERSPWLAKHAASQGHEVSAHGWRWQKSIELSPEEELAAILKTSETIKAATGQAPKGWHTRSTPSPNTRRYLVENGFLYDSDAYNDDTPYVLDIAGHRHVVLPYAFDTNDMQFQNTQRFGTGDDFAHYVCAAYDWLWREGDTKPRMLSIGLHLRMIGRPGRIGSLEKIMQHIHTRGGAWVATREQIARHWLDSIVQTS